MPGALTTDAMSSHTLYVAIWVQYGLCTVVMALRAYSQFFVLRKFSADDIVMLGAYLCQGVASALCTVSTSYGLGDNITALQYADIVQTLKFAMISQPFGVFAPLLGRISFILFLLATVILANDFRRKLLWGLIGFQVILNVIPVILQFTQCDPVSALWNPLQLIQSCQGAVVVQRWGYFQGAFNGLTDLILISIGLTVIMSLKMRRSNKIVLGVILSLSLLAMVAAILKAVYIRKLNTFNFSYALGLWCIWFLTEGTVVIVTASVPRLRAIVVIRRQTKSSYNAYVTPPSDSNGDPSSKRRSARTTYIHPSVDDAPMFTTGLERDAISEEGLQMESQTSLSHNRVVKEASQL
ncbi:hypothetical protein BJX99DRAFT_265625 [Aspergillus californicus]